MPVITPRSRKDKKEPATRASFQNRKTIADHLKATMAKNNRHSYYQRVVFITRHKGTQKRSERVPSLFEKLIVKCRENLFDERVTGMFMFYELHSICMLEGSEEVLAVFFMNLLPLVDELFESSKVILVFNNILGLFFRRVVWRTANPPIMTENVMSMGIWDIEQQNIVILTKFHKICDIVANDIDEGSASANNEVISSEYRDSLPELSRLEIVLNTPHMMTLTDFGRMFRTISPCTNYSDKVWPIPYDLTPKNIFTIDKYDVNLTFPAKEKELREQREQKAVGQH